MAVVQPKSQKLRLLLTHLLLLAFVAVIMYPLLMVIALVGLTGCSGSDPADAARSIAGTLQLDSAAS